MYKAYAKPQRQRDGNLEEYVEWLSKRLAGKPVRLLCRSLNWAAFPRSRMEVASSKTERYRFIKTRDLGATAKARTQA